ncbi:MAG: hypothetical protein Q9227_004785 [Pyrenula ochraceoflavens]
MAPETPSSSESITYSSGREEDPELRILHFNDVYHIESGSAEPVGGIARFQTLVNTYRKDPKYSEQPALITFFSGDAFNPSLESSVTKGRHMVPVLNKIGTDAACVGNHDLDFGIAQFRHLRKQCHFPWLLANVLDPALGENVALANCEKTYILTSSNGIKIGLIGLAEREWLDTVNSLPPNLIYKSASATAEELVPPLRDQGCELIVAITHMREPNDLKLAEKTRPGLIDLILGGHDHFYNHSLVNSTHVLRSGTDFKQLSYIEGWKKAGGGWDFNITRRDVVRSVPECASTVQLVDQLTSSLKAKLEKPIGYAAAPLDGRFTTVRTRESNLGNFVCDLMRFYYGTDCALMAAGTIRGDQIYPPGMLRLKDIMNCFPFEDPVVVLEISGQALHEALENAVSLVPALEGRYPQVSNITFEYHPGAPSGSRVQWIRVNEEPLDLAKMYTLATRGYMARGKDGFDSLLVKSEGGEIEEIVSEENGVLISTILRQYFLSLKVFGKWKRWSSSLHRHWGQVHEKLHVNGKIKEARPSAPTTPEMEKKSTTVKEMPSRPPKHGRNGSLRHQDSVSSIARRQQGEVDFHSTDGAGPMDLLQHRDSELVDSDSDHSEVEHRAPANPFLGKQAREQAALSLSHQHVASNDGDRAYHIARSVAKKWMRIAGVKRESVGLVDDASEEFTPEWTRGIAPRVEGRIRIKGSS